MELEDFLSNYIDGLGTAIDRLVEEVTPDRRATAGAWNAYCEFVYAVVFLCDQELGRALQKRGCGEATVLSAIQTIDKVLLIGLLSRRTNVTPGSEAAEQMYQDHHSALEKRGERWLHMTLFPRDDAPGAGGSLIWEVPAQALASAGNSDPLAKLSMSLRFQRMLVEAAQIPTAMDVVAQHVE